MLLRMKRLAALAFLIAAALPLAAQQQPVPYSITCYTPQNCTATPQPGVTVIYDNRPKLSDTLGELSRQLREQATQQQLQQLHEEQIRVTAANSKAISDANDRIIAEALDKMNAQPKAVAPQPSAEHETGEMLTGGWANGRMWAAMDETNRLIYLLAICEGTWRVEGAPQRCNITNRIAMMNWISNFYSYAQPGYDLIPISSVQWFYAHEKSSDEIAKYVRDYLAAQQPKAPTEGNLR